MVDVLQAGVDEAGRGPLAGPVVAAAVVLPPRYAIENLRDSKKLSAAQRDKAFAAIKQVALAVGMGQATCTEIDTINILQASMLAMKRAVADLRVRPDRVLCDGKHCPDLGIPVTAIVRGDAIHECISAASIVAKVIRDRVMVAMHARYPDYGFDRHKGYPTAEHRAALQRYGPCREHRRTFAPVSRCLKREMP